MKSVLIMRHGKSRVCAPNESDHERRLNKRGMKDVPMMGRLLKERGLVPDVILASTAVRAQATAQAVATACSASATPEFLGELYLAEADTYIATLADLPAEHELVLVVGHNPGLETLVRVLTGELEAMPTAAIAHVTLPVHDWAEVPTSTLGTLVDLWEPRSVDAK